MRLETLPSPGFLSNGIRLRIEAQKAISATEINAGIPSNVGKSSNAFALKTFFDFCSASIAGFLDVVAPTIAARSISSSDPSTLVLTYSEGLDAKFVPAASTFAITGQVRTIESVKICSPFVHLKVTVPFTAGAVSVAYTQAGNANDLRDFSANKAASFVATAVTNGVV
jgi:hypothetical protein